MQIYYNRAKSQLLQRSYLRNIFHPVTLYRQVFTANCTLHAVQYKRHKIYLKSLKITGKCCYFVHVYL